MCDSDEGFDRKLCKNINGIPTEFVLQKFSNKYFLLISQYEEICNLYSVEFDIKEAIPSLSPITDDPDHHVSVPIKVTCNFGADRDEIHSAIQFLVNNSNLHKCPDKFVISFGLKEINGKNLRQIAEVLDSKFFLK